MTLRLLICDDHHAIRLGVQSLVANSEIEVAFEAESCREAVRLATTQQPDVVLLDVRLGSDDGMDALSKIKSARPALPVLMFSATDDLNDMAFAHKLGADGYLLKTVGRDALLLAIRRAALGKKTWSITQIRKIKSRAGASAANERKRVPLSRREEQVLRKLAAGTTSNESIAEDLGIDIETVKQYVRGILKKLHVEDRTQAALWALQNRAN